jgi:hypothetical protein
MRFLLVAAWLLLSPLASALAQVSIQFNLPGVSIGVNQPAYPQLVQVPGYPVYYDPRADSNYFFYEGLYWVYQGDSWYSSEWYDGPWALMGPQEVPLFVLRVPVRYYRRPPQYFQGWGRDAPPRWGEHWGHDWERQHGGWDQWNRREAPRPAPLPAYQRQYSGQRYPSAEQQGDLRERHYRYEPRDAAVKQLIQRKPAPPAAPPPSRPAQEAQPGRPTERGQPSRETRQPGEPARHPAAPAAQPPTQHAQPQPPQQQQHAQPPAQQQHAQPAPPQQHAQPQQAQPPAAREKGGPAQGGKHDSKEGPGQSRGEERGGDRGRERGGERDR